METTTSAIATVGMVVAVIAALPVTGFAAAGVVDSTSDTGIAPGVSGAGAGIAPGAADDHENTTSAGGNASGNGSIAPGAMLSGVVGVQEAEIEGEVTARAFGIRIKNATSNESKASVIAEQLQAIRDRLAELREERKELRQARRNGSISADQYKARLAALSAKVQSVKRLTNRTENATRGLPDELLREKGINVSAIRTLKQNASELTGPEVAAIARQIAGPDVGKALGRGKAPEGVGPPERNGSVGGPPARNGSAGGPPERNGSEGGPPATPGNGSGNETRGDGQDGNGTDAGGSDNGTAPARGGADNGSDPARNGSRDGNGSAPVDEQDANSGGSPTESRADAGTTTNPVTAGAADRWLV